MLRSPTLAVIACAGLLAALPAARAGAADQYLVHTFKKLKLSDQFYSEGANLGDFNHDGRPDVVSGPYWYEGPEFTKKHEFYPAKTFEGAHGYSDNFFAFAYDFNGDHWDDVLVIGFPGKDATWYENPQGKDGPWAKHKVFDVVDNESPTFADLTGDGKPELIFTTGGRIGYAEPDWKDPAKPWTFHPISEPGGWQRFTHGIGIGDVNGDGRKDLLMAEGWWEQPAKLDGDPVWTKHPARFGRGGAQMHAADLNGDGVPDVLSSVTAHEYGLAWYEQHKDGTFTEHLLMGDKAEQNPYGLKFTELHAVELVDMDGDGLPDIVTGKRFWAHGPKGDPEAGEPAVLYWWKQVRDGKGGVQFIPYLIDDDSGIGTQVVVGDLNGDKLPDIVVGNKKGTFVFLHEVKQVGKEEWEKAQPKPVKP
jgi:hypothetical protein